VAANACGSASGTGTHVALHRLQNQRMQHHRIAAPLLLLATMACTPLTTQRAGNDETVNLMSEETALRRAAEKAQATLDDFLTKAKQQPAGTSGYALKVRVEDGRDSEDFWVQEFTWSDGSFTGKINDEPRQVKSVKLGQVHTFNRSQVADWRYLDETKGKTIGNFTVCALLSTQAPARAEEIKRRDGLDCS
jgi:uncharacterized protein YegJ (DUF2314 family)